MVRDCSRVLADSLPDQVRGALPTGRGPRRGPAWVQVVSERDRNQVLAE